MRAYSLAVVADALSVDRKWLDNVLTQHSIEGVHREGQGVSRSIAPHAILTIATAIAIVHAFGSPLGRALTIAAELVRDGEPELGPELSLRVDVSAIERRLTVQLAESVDAHLLQRRGRPPHHSTEQSPLA